VVHAVGQVQKKDRAALVHGDVARVRLVRGRSVRPVEFGT
jgi:hypothetical protein